MFEWLRKLTSNKPAPLAGQPKHRRQKTYTADSGYVYEYFYEGYRVSAGNGETGAEHVFQFSADRKQWAFVSVFLPDNSVAWWERTHDRLLSATERYAIVKMALFHAFDERDEPGQMSQQVRVRETDIHEIVDELGIEGGGAQS